MPKELHHSQILIVWIGRKLIYKKIILKHKLNERILLEDDFNSSKTQLLLWNNKNNITKIAQAMPKMGFKGRFYFFIKEIIK